MADEKKPTGGEEDFGDSGLGNLPPLSDFDSQAGFSGEGDLPPISGFDSGGLPPLSDLDVQTPVPRDMQSDAAMSFDSGPTSIDTPAVGRGFQDLAADSDFSPETPEVGPGPDSNVDTPMFDSAFGGGSGFDMGGGTPAPTQAMETPMFGGDQGGFGGGFSGGGGSGGGFGFDDNAFAAGTPAPDFSPDTGIQRPGASAFPEPPPTAPPPKKRGAGLAVVLALIGLFIGVAASPWLSPYLTFLPNPMARTIDDQATEIQRLKSDLANAQRIDSGTTISPEELSRLTQEIADRTKELNDLQAQLETTQLALAEQQENLRLVEEDLATKSEEYALAQQAYEDLQNETAIIQARQRGLVSEVERLTGLVGELDEANAIRAASKDALAHNVDRLLIHVQDSMPLTPEKYNHAARVAAVESFRDKVRDAPWVTPELMQEYTSLYLNELQVGALEEYFFAKMPVIDRFGQRTQKWAEALMLGNRAVYYRSLDGQNIGIYQNTGTADTPRWMVNEVEDKALRQGIESRVFEARVPGFEEKVQYLAERELSEEEGTAFQRAFSSL